MPFWAKFAVFFGCLRENARGHTPSGHTPPLNLRRMATVRPKSRSRKPSNRNLPVTFLVTEAFRQAKVPTNRDAQQVGVAHDRAVPGTRSAPQLVKGLGGGSDRWRPPVPTSAAEAAAHQPPSAAKACAGARLWEVSRSRRCCARFERAAPGTVDAYTTVDAFTVYR
eukprot:scaffold16051_cov75-Phaeocystis_antarctica.AAC.2